MLPLHFYHATTSKAARSIERSQFRPGDPKKRRYAGAAIYFSADPQNAIHHCFNGVKAKAAEVVICCSVDLGKCLRAEKHAVDKDECLARGCDSVQIIGTDTYAVYDSARISIKEFRRIADNVCWHPSAAPSAIPSAIMIAAIQASPKGSLKLIEVCELYSKHPSLLKAIRAAGGLTNFCEEHAELTRDGDFVTMTPSVKSSAAPLAILVEAIQASPNGSLNVSSKLGELYSKHPNLHEAVRAAGGLTDFCKEHAELTKVGLFVRMTRSVPSAAPLNQGAATMIKDLFKQKVPHLEHLSKQSVVLNLQEALCTPGGPSAAPSVDPSAAPLAIIIAAIRGSPNGCLNASIYSGKMGELYSKHPGLDGALRAAGGLRSFCDAHAELTIDGNFLTEAKAKPPMALDIVVAAIQASPHGSLNVTSHISELCLKHPDFHQALRATGGVEGFCKVLRCLDVARRQDASA